MLSCTCHDLDDAEWYYTVGEFDTLFSLRSRICQSCGSKIRPGKTCLNFHRIKYDDNGNEVPLADYYLCESCGEIYLNLEAIGYCCQLGMDLRDDLADYHDLTGFDPAKYVQETLT